jgi:hypothetical protein
VLPGLNEIDDAYKRPPAPPPPAVPPPPPPPPAITSTSPVKDKEVALTKVSVPVVVNVWVLYPPAEEIVPPPIAFGFALNISAMALPLPTPLFSEVGPKVPLTLLTKGIYFSLEVEVSRA